MLKHIFKRWLLIKWVIIIHWRVLVQRRTVYALSDVPKAVLRWFAIYGDGFIDEEYSSQDAIQYWNTVFDAVCCELEIRKLAHNMNSTML